MVIQHLWPQSLLKAVLCSFYSYKKKNPEKKWGISLICWVNCKQMTDISQATGQLYQRRVFCPLFAWSKQTLSVHWQGHWATTHNWPTVTEVVVIGVGFKTQELLCSGPLFTDFLSCVDYMKRNNSFNQLRFFARDKIKGKNAFIWLWKCWNSLQHVEKGLELGELLTWICF